MNDHNFKEYYHEYLECCAVLNSLKQDPSPDIGFMHKVIIRMDELKILMKEDVKVK